MIPFRAWPEGTPFEVMDGAQTRYGVRLPGTERDKFRAFMFDTNQIESITHNRKVSAVRTVRGRLARTHDNRLIVVKHVQKDLWAAYYVNLTGYASLDKSEFDLIPVEVGERRNEVNIIYQKLQNIRDKEHKLLQALEILLFE